MARLKKRRKPPALSSTGGIRDAVCDIAQTSLIALKESSDAFPPLKSLVGGVLVLWETAQRLERNKSDIDGLARRCVEILEVLADAIPDPTNIAPEILTRILHFECLIHEITTWTKERAKSKEWIPRLLSLNRNEDRLSDFRRRLDEACQSFMLGSALRLEIKVDATVAKADCLEQSLSSVHSSVLKTNTLLQLSIVFLW
ncbi:hypothetical protein C8J56DRAFT_1063640 [Mycena floridula]|nr:hypothetical protein C8J56DRAFT_1063640 [Mycena floridula]